MPSVFVSSAPRAAIMLSLPTIVVVAANGSVLQYFGSAGTTSM